MGHVCGAGIQVETFEPAVAELVRRLQPDDVVVPVPIRRGDCTVHNERVLHGSGGNETDGFRRAYVLAYRAEATVAIERELGFTHSHNDDLEVLDEVGVQGETRPGSAAS